MRCAFVKDCRLAVFAILLAASPVPSVAASQHQNPDFADSLSGGPDHWKVVGVPAGGTLILRTGPSPRAKKTGDAANGTVLRNLGCRIALGQRWCQVERTDAPFARGWVKGIHLRENTGKK